jgi:hypothetical protein
MKKIITVLASPLITLGLALTFATPAQAQASSPFPGASCGGNGSFRWPVKTGADADRYNVDTTPIDTSISHLHGLPPPTQTALDSSYAKDHRINYMELHTWQLTGDVLETISLNSHDSDLHMIIKDSSGHHIVAEVPWPGCVSSLSLWMTDISTVRHYLDALYPTSVSQPVQTVNREVTIRGLGFFDHSENTGQKYYHIELHPVIYISFS